MTYQSDSSPNETAASDATAEINHLIANSLARMASLTRIYGLNISKQTRLMRPDEVRLLLEEFGGRLHTVAGLHRLLAERKASSVEIADYLQDLSRKIVSSLSLSSDSELQFDCDPECRLASDKALAVGLIVCELVTNAVKYAHPAGVPGHIKVACRNACEGGVVIEVADDGVGLPEGTDLMRDCGLGFRLVRSLVDQIEGSIEIRDEGLGVGFVVQVPAAPPRPGKIGGKPVASAI